MSCTSSPFTMNMPYSQKHKFSPSRLLEVKIILNTNFDKNELKSVQDKLSSSYQVTQPVGAKVPRSEKDFQKKKKKISAKTENKLRCPQTFTDRT